MCSADEDPGFSFRIGRWLARPAPVPIPAAGRSGRLALAVSFGHSWTSRRKGMMRDIPRLRFPAGSLLVAMLAEQAPTDVRRAAQRLRAEGAPALAIDDDVAGLARGLAFSEVSRSPAVLDALPPLFWLEAQREDGSGARGIIGWVVEKRGGGLAVRGFSIAPGHEAAPEPALAATVPFGPGADEDEETRYVRGLVTAISLPEMLSQMGESPPVVLMPADASEREAGLLRGFRLSVAIPPDAAPT
jgi:hypothetical protein